MFGHLFGYLGFVWFGSPRQVDGLSPAIASVLNAARRTGEWKPRRTGNGEGTRNEE